MPTMSQENIDFIKATVADVQRTHLNQGFTLKFSGPAGDWAWAFGDGNRRPQVPMGINDRGRIGSTTKSMIAWAILREIDLGTPIPGVTPAAPVTLSTKLFHFVSGIPKSDQITIADLLMMRSGVYDYQTNMGLKFKVAFGLAGGFNEPTDQLSLIRGNTTNTVPGTTFEYTNSNYVLLGEILRMLTGRNWRNIIQEDILNPLGMTQTKIPAHQDWMLPEPWMHGFGVHMWGAIFGKDQDQSAFNPDIFGCAGSLISTAGDLDIWGRAMASGYGLSPAMVLAQQNSHIMYDWDLGAEEGVPQFGYGWGSFRTKEWVGHDGSVPGFGAQCMYHPPTGAVISGLENYQSADVAIFSRVFIRTARKLYPGSI